MIEFQSLVKTINENNSFLLTTHVNPDADALGSELAFYFLLKKLGKEAYIINHSATPYNLAFLDTEKVIEKYSPEKHADLFDSVDVVVLLDLNQAARVVSMEKKVREFKGKKIIIDHHQNAEQFADEYYNSTDCSATSEILYDFIDNTKIVEIDYNIALQLYAAIMTDTGSFRFERTTPKVHMIVADLISKGVSPVYVYEEVYNQGNFARIKLLGEALESIKLSPSGRVAYMTITQEAMRRTGATDADIDGLVDYCLSIINVKIGLLFYELKDGLKMSFRSKDDINVNKLAAKYQGGGHTNASGARLFNVKLEDYVEKVVEEADKYFD